MDVLSSSLYEKVVGCITHILSSLVPLSLLTFFIVSNDSLASGVTQTLDYLFLLELGLYFVFLMLSDAVHSPFIKYHATITARFALFSTTLFFNISFLQSFFNQDISKLPGVWLLITCFVVIWFAQSIYAAFKAFSQQTWCYLFQIDFNQRKTSLPASSPIFSERLHASLMYLIVPIILAASFLFVFKNGETLAILGTKISETIWDLILRSTCLMIGLTVIIVLEIYLHFLSPFVAYHAENVAIFTGRRFVLGSIFIFSLISASNVLRMHFVLQPGLKNIPAIFYAIPVLFLFWYLQMFYAGIRVFFGKEIRLIK